MGRRELDQLKDQKLNLKNKMTEKNYNPQQRTEKTMKKQHNVTQKIEQKSNIAETKKHDEKKQKAEPLANSSFTGQIEEKKAEKKTEDGKQEISRSNRENSIRKKIEQKVKKTEASVNGMALPISTKDSVAICRFIKGKKIEMAIADLEQVLAYKKAIPMKGEIPHRKGKGMMSGRYPKNTAVYFIKLLKSLSANANELEEPIITEAIANLASRPFGRFGRIRKKRSHIKIKAVEKKIILNNKIKVKK